VTKRITAVLGTLLFLLGVVSLLLVWRDQAAARSVDESFPLSESGEESSCQNIIQEASLSKRVMTEKESQTLTIVLANLSGLETCHTTVRLAALDFEIAPPVTEREVALEPDGKPVTLLWILKPRETGSFEIAITAGNQVQVLGIVVTNVLGFTAGQVQILSSISSLLGPMLTVPWWYEQWEKRKKARKEEAEKAAAVAAAQAAVKDGGSKRSAEDFRPE